MKNIEERKQRLVDDFEECLKSYDGSPDSVEGMIGFVESFVDYNMLDYVDKAMAITSNKALLTGILHSDIGLSTLDIFKKYFEYNFKSNISMFESESKGVSDSKFLFIALLYEKLDIVKYLIGEKKIKVEDKDLIEYLNERSNDIVEAAAYLLESGTINVNFADGKLLEWVLRSVDYSKNGVSLVKYLLDNGANISTNDYKALDMMFESDLFDDILKDLIKGKK